MQRFHYISSGFGVGSGTATFQADCVIKYANNAYLYTYGQVSFPSSGINPVFTSKDDDLIGEQISGSSGSPTYHAQPALNIYYVTFNTTIQNILVRWAKTGIRYDENNGVSATHSLINAVFRDCQTGVHNNGTTVELTSVKKCGVSTATSGENGYDFDGSMANDCPDMILMSDDMNADDQKPTIWYNTTAYDTNSCEVIEGTVGGTGIRKHLIFGVKIKSNGSGHFYGERDHYRRLMDGSGGTPDWKTFDSCHNHCHLAFWSKFELLILDGTPASGVSGSGKLGWHMYDWFYWCTGPSFNFSPGDGSCNPEMGMSIGYCDLYERGTSGQWLDITNVSSGTYKLRITINDGNKRYEGNYANNIHEVTVTIP